MSESSSSSMVPWVVGGGVALAALVGGGLYVSSQNAKAQAEMEAKLKAAEDAARHERELAAARASTSQQSSGGGGGSSAGNPLAGLGSVINGIGGAVKSVTDFFSGFKL